MKKLIVVLCCALVHMSCEYSDSTCEGYGQKHIKDEPYIPMIVPGNQWNELAKNISVSPEYQYERTYLTKIGNSTVVNGVTYYELLSAEDSLSSEWKTKGLVREDTEKQQVYFKTADSPEILWYAFRVQVGDILKSRDITWGDEVSIRVEAIDSLLIGGAWHKRITMRVGNDSYGKNHTWIEGIGGTDGLLQNNISDNPPGSSSFSLLCFSQSGQLIYKADNGIDECFVWKYIRKSLECAQTEKVGELNIQNVKLLKTYPENPNSIETPYIYEIDGIVLLDTRISWNYIIYEVCNFPKELLQSNENLTVDIRGNIFKPSRYWGFQPANRGFYDLEITNIEIQ